MGSVKYELRVKGLSVPHGTIPVRALLELLQGLVDTAERGLRLAVEGESVKRGKAPGWIAAAVDLNFTGLKTGSTVLGIEAPTFRDTIGNRLENQEQNFSRFRPMIPPCRSLLVLSETRRMRTARVTTSMRAC